MYWQLFTTSLKIQEPHLCFIQELIFSLPAIPKLSLLPAAQAYINSNKLSHGLTAVRHVCIFKNIITLSIWAAVSAWGR